MKDSNKRSLSKALSWRLTATIVLATVSYIFTGSALETVWITMVYNIIQIVVYFIHERAWERVRWGKKPDNSRFPHASQIPPEELAQMREHLQELGYIE
jgi:uncharacterized membrane protein